MNTVDQHEFNIVLNHVYGDAVTASRIIAGALWLDQVNGISWWENFNLDTFDINSGERCVLGQVVRGECTTGYPADFHRAVYETDYEHKVVQSRLGDAAKYALPWDVAKAFGFHLLDDETADWSVKMNRGWYALIASRQGRPTVFPEHQVEEPDDEGIETDEG